MKITDEQLLAYIDGELSPEERARVEAAIARDPDLAERLRKHRSVESRIHEAFSGVAEEPAPEHLVEKARPAAPVVSLDAARATRKTEPKPGKTTKAPKSGKPAAPSGPSAKFDRRWALPIFALIAGAALGYFAPRTGTGLMDGEMRATGGLDAVLTNRLASTQGADAPIRIGSTFKNRSGAWCRSFTSAQLSGVACREGGGWRLKLAEPGSVARTPSPAAAAAIAALIAGAPDDDATEKQAQGSGWR